VTRYRIVKDGKVTDGIAQIIVAQGQPKEGFPSATDAALWATPLSGEWYIQPFEGTDAVRHDA
jgi:hypothetical protein